MKDPSETRGPSSKNATWAVSRILSSYSHLSGPDITARARAVYLERNGRAALFLLDLAPDGVCRADAVARAAGGLLHHRFTLACAREGHRRSSLCCTVHRVTPPGCYPAPSPCGVRTFLNDCSPRLSAHVARDSVAAQPVSAPWELIGGRIRHIE